MSYFQTAVIGSLPRPTFVRELVLDRLHHSKDGERLLNDAIRYAVALQEQAGIDIISDGEWRRATFFDLLAHISHGFTLTEDPLTPALRTLLVTEKVKPRTQGFLAQEVKFLRSITNRKIKTTLPSPALLGERMWHPELSKHAYATRESFVKACVPLLREELRLAIQAGATVIQIDDPYLCIFVDEEFRRKQRDPEKTIEFSIQMINALVEGFDAHFGVHLCRRAGARSVGAHTFSGAFDFLVPFLNTLQVHELALEFTAPNSGDFTVLQHLRPQLHIGLGCLSVHHGQIDTPETIVARVEKALRYIESSRLTLTPDCGFAPSSTIKVDLDEVFEKLRNLSKAAGILRKRFTTSPASQQSPPAA